ncbi:FAD-binding protein [Actinomadura monticuli]|uniref:FAD-binding protein n=1 Tax=Actinomadura monticuli TaxID=3097367 RepID=A0ABV4Q4X3_9ACTN
MTSDAISQEFDRPLRSHIVIVGAGLAGLETANELVRHGVHDVLVLEAGPAGDLRHVNVAHAPETALRMWLQPGTDAYFDRPWSSRTPSAFAAGSGIRRRVGGRSLYWYGVSLRLEPWALAAPWWPAAVVADLTGSWRGGKSLYEQVERHLADWRSDGAEAAGPLAAGRPAARLGDLDLLPVPFARRPAGPGAERWYAYTPLDRWRDPVSGETRPAGPSPRPPVWTGVEVERVVVRDGRARGVVARDARTGAAVRIAADRVVLAAGTIESSRLAIQALGERAPAPRPRLSGLCDHMVQGVFARLSPQQGAALTGVVPEGSYYAPGDAATRANTFLELRRLPDGSVLVDLQATGEQLPSEENYVECGPASGARSPAAVRAAPRGADLDVLAAERELLRGAWDRLGEIAGLPRTALSFGDFERPDRTNELLLPEHLGSLDLGAPATWSGHLGTEDHEGGTLPLGRVLDEDHQFAGVPGLYAAGPSTFPRMGAANPSLTTLALAHRLAAVLAGRAR